MTFEVATAVVAVAAAPRETILDRAELDANTLGDPALQKELFELFFGHADQALDRMEQALVECDAAAWTAAAHGIKGTARTLGLLRLGGVAAETEASAPCAKRFNAMRDALTAATTAAQSYIAQRCAASA